MSTNTPIAEQIRIAFFGLRNSGKSSLMNNLFEREIVIVSDHPGTTTDPVTKSMELLPVGPVAVTDTAGLDDTGEIGALRVKKSREILKITDVPVFVTRGDAEISPEEKNFFEDIAREKSNSIIVVTHADAPTAEGKKKWTEGHSFVSVDNISGKGVEDFKKLLIRQCREVKTEITPVEGIVTENDLVVLVTPIDLAAPKGRLILPQVETIRDLLDRDCAALILKERELKYFFDKIGIRPKLVITDSQAFSKVSADIPEDVPLTSFSILFARKKGDLSVFVEGAKALNTMRKEKSALKVMVLESCAHHKQADDIGTVKIPRLYRQLVNSKAEFIFAKEIPDEKGLEGIGLVIQCAGCMVTRNLVMSRIEALRAKSIPVINYGLFLAWANGLLPRALEPFPYEHDLYGE